MKRPFYQYIQKHRSFSGNHPSLLSEFAETVYLDGDFPKDVQDFSTLSDYIELNDRYTDYVAVFDRIWESYNEEE